MHTSDQLVANMHLSEMGLRELASGVDALYLSARAELPKHFVAHLEDCREWAAEAKRPAPCEIGDPTFGIAAHGWGKYRFCLDHQMARIGFSTSRHLPTVRVQPRSEFLHAVGPEAAVRALQRLLGAGAGPAAFLGEPGRPLRRLAGLVAQTRRRPTLRLPGRRPSHLRGRRHPDRLRVRQPQDQDLLWLASTTRRPTSPPRATTGGTRSGATRYVTGTARPPPRVRGRSPGPDRVRPRHARPRSWPPLAICGSTPPGSG